MGKKAYTKKQMKKLLAAQVLTNKQKKELKSSTKKLSKNQKVLETPTEPPPINFETSGHIIIAIWNMLTPKAMDKLMKEEKIEVEFVENLLTNELGHVIFFCSRSPGMWKVAGHYKGFHHSLMAGLIPHELDGGTIH